MSNILIFTNTPFPSRVLAKYFQAQTVHHVCADGIHLSL
jgi:hypothetical protein